MNLRASPGPSLEQKEKIPKNTFLGKQLHLYDLIKDGIENGRLEEGELADLSTEDLILFKKDVLIPWIKSAESRELYGNIRYFRYIMATVLTFGLSKKGFLRTALPLPSPSGEGLEAAHHLIEQIEQEINSRKSAAT